LDPDDPITAQPVSDDHRRRLRDGVQPLLQSGAHLGGTIVKPEVEIGDLSACVEARTQQILQHPASQDYERAVELI
jgi:hypothetical protein